MEKYFVRERGVFKISQLSKIKLFTKTVAGWKPLSIFEKISTLDVWHSSECASGRYTDENQLFLNAIYHLYKNFRHYRHFWNPCIDGKAWGCNQNALFIRVFIRIIYIRIKRFKNRWKTIFWNNLAHHLTSRVLLCSFKLLISFYPIKITFLLTFYVNFVNLGPKNAVYPYVSVRKSSLSKLSEKVHYLKTQQKKLYMKSSAFNRSTWKNKCF